MLHPDVPALALAPMDGITDAPMRAFQGLSGAFTYSVTEFLRVSGTPIPAKVFRRDVPELACGGRTLTGLPVQVQLLGGDPGRMAASAFNACRAGANAVDINFGCPAPTVNRHDGGASLLREPCRIREIVRAVREAVPPQVPVSAKLRLGWDSTEPVFENAEMAEEGGASWLTIHARTRVQGYAPPVFWRTVGAVRRTVGIPVVANGDIFTFEDFLRCEDETGCRHFMIGRGALANPALGAQIARSLGIGEPTPPWLGWLDLFKSFVAVMDDPTPAGQNRALRRLKQWTNLARLHAKFGWFDELKRTESLAEFLCRLEALVGPETEAAVLV